LGNIKEAIEACLETLAARQDALPHERGIIVATVEAEAPATVTV
jgi:predicted RNase H-like HicB family nuclease